jgi:hypothetical protein
MGRRRESPLWLTRRDWLECADDEIRRRTHQSGPLGELFDHGVDALNTSLECLIFAASQNLGMGWKTVAVLFGCASSLHPTLKSTC